MGNSINKLFQIISKKTGFDIIGIKKYSVNFSYLIGEYIFSLMSSLIVGIAVARYLDSECYQHSDDIVNAWRLLYADTISAGGNSTVGLKSDGTVVAAGYNEYGQCDVEEWRNIALPKNEEQIKEMYS